MVSFLKKEKESLGLFLGLLLFFVFFQLKSVYGGDSGDFLSAASVWGVPHPPGYPLYAFLTGLLHNFLTWGMPAWRLAFLFSIPSALAIVFLYKGLSLFLAKKISLISCLVLAFSYPFWLYSEVVEVFALNNFFIIILTYLLLKAIKNKKENLSLFFVFLGLSFCHHQTIFFLLPAIYFIFKKENLFRRIKLTNILFFLLSLLPYLYLPLAAKKNPAINWNNPINFKNFINLISRKVYGTFMANQGILTDYKGRFFNILAFFRFLRTDFSLIGVLLIILGIGSTFFLKQKSKKTISQYFLIGLISYIFFIFYASFNIFGDFYIATFERFLLAPYIFLTVFLAYGLNFLYQLIEKFTFDHKLLIKTLFLIIFLLVLPISQLIKNFPKISILKNDLTAENFAQDVLDSLDKKGVIFTHSDTSHFDTQYVFYSLGYRKNEVKYINVFMLPADYYQNYLKKQYPNLKINSQKKDFYNWQFFLEENYQQVPIYSIPAKETTGYEMVPMGLTIRYFKPKDVPGIDEVIQINDRLWRNYHNPLSASLSKYKNLFLADVVNYYQFGAKRLGEYLIKYNKWEKAEEYLDKSASFKIKDPELDLLLGRVYLHQKKCEQAENQFKKVKKALPNNPFPDAYLRQVYLDCFQNQQKAKDFLNSCLEKEEDKSIQLKDL